MFSGRPGGGQALRLTVDQLIVRHTRIADCLGDDAGTFGLAYQPQGLPSRACYSALASLRDREVGSPMAADDTDESTLLDGFETG